MSTEHDNMIQLIEDKSVAAAAMPQHSAVIHDGQNLKDLFGAGDKAEEILKLLLNANSSSGDRLVVPKKPDESKLFELVNSAGMGASFSSSERDVVKAWIMSLEESSDESDERNKMIELLKSKQGTAKLVHGGIPANGRTLNEEFDEEKYQEILDFLLSSNSAKAPTEGDPFVVKGDARNSAIYKQFKDGVMAGQFTDEELEVVANWINSLSDN